MEDLINKASAFIGNRLQKLGEKFDALGETLESVFAKKIDALSAAMLKKQDDSFLRTQFTSLIRKLDEAVVAISSAKPEVKARVEFGEMISAIKNIKIPEQKTIDLEPLEIQLDFLLREIKTDKQAALSGKLDALLAAVKAIKFEFPKEWKIEEQQFRALRQAGSPVIVGGGGGGARMNATRITVANVSMAAANTEYPYTFPANTVNFVMKLRAQNVAFKYTWTSGESGTTYITAPAGFIRGQNDVEISGRVIYFQSTTASNTMEIESYRM